MNVANDDNWGSWVRHILDKYMWAIIVGVLLALDFISGKWVISMAEKVINQLGDIL